LNAIKYNGYYLKGACLLRLFAFFIIFIFSYSCACSDKSIEPVEYDHSRADYDADWSPDGSKLIFTRVNYPPKDFIGGLYFYNSSDSSVTLFLQNNNCSCPRFSPDGQWIVFSSGKEIYIIQTGGDSLRQLTSSYNNYEPDWSPGGKKIAYEHRIGDDRGIHILDIETGSDKLIHPYSSIPRWMPNGEQIALFSWVNREMHLIIIDTLGNTVREFNDPNSYKRTMDISPDGRYICFDQQYPNNKIFLNMLDIETGKITQLFPFASGHPAFSLGGMLLAFTRMETHDGSLWILNLETEEKKQITLLELAD
jgi:Tol biopolymer transport system component